MTRHKTIGSRGKERISPMLSKNPLPGTVCVSVEDLDGKSLLARVVKAQE